jgi:uncharacterized membrane protein
LGDDDLGSAASYLAGVMTHYGLPYDHVPSSRAADANFRSCQYALYVVSDYPAGRFRSGEMEHVAECVRAGSGLAMLGGWESFHGRLGEYHRSPLAEVLPVEMADSDDRRNCAQPCLIRQVATHPILEGLPWDCPPGIGGFNAFTARPAAHTVLTAVQFAVRRPFSPRPLAGEGQGVRVVDSIIASEPTAPGGDFEFSAGAESPLLVVGECGRGRTAALATDVAPHWVGGLVDWGDGRVVQEVNAGAIDVGNWYARFFRNLLVWTGRLEAGERRPRMEHG